MEKYDNETLKHLQQVQLMILNDFIEICDENNLEYYAYGGTVLGAIRHHGFIPWDDDIDVFMFREDYEKFLKIMDKTHTEKYEILNIDRTKDYLYMFSKMSLKGTKFENNWCINKPFNVGINIDIFVLDYIPTNKFKWSILNRKFKFLKKIFNIFDIIENDYYISDFKKNIGHTIRFIFKLLNITNETFKRKYAQTLQNMHANSMPNGFLYDIAAISYDEILSEDMIRPSKKVPFESICIAVPNDYDKYLKINFGNYMELPPEDKRVNHLPRVLDFGKY